MAETSKTQITPENNEKRHQQKQRSIKPFKNNFKQRKCYYCGKKGHLKNNCFAYKKVIERKRIVQLTMKPESDDANTSGFAFMTNSKITEKYGEQNEITFVLAVNFVKLQKPINIYVAKNGAFVQATKKGNLSVTRKMGVSGVLQVYFADLPV